MYPDSLGAGRLAKIGIPYADVMGPLVNDIALVCSVLIAIARRTRVATLPLIAVMCVALLTDKLRIVLGTDFWIFELRSLERYGLLSALHESSTDLAMLASLILLTVTGSGRWISRRGDECACGVSGPLCIFPACTTQPRRAHYH